MRVKIRLVSDHGGNERVEGHTLVKRDPNKARLYKGKHFSFTIVRP